MSERLNELTHDLKEEAREAKTYRHDIRGEIQRLIIDIDRINYERQLRTKELEEMSKDVAEIKKRLTQADGGVALVRWLWGGAVAVVLLIGDWALRKWG